MRAMRGMLVSEGKAVVVEVQEGEEEGEARRGWRWRRCICWRGRIRIGGIRWMISS